MAEDKMSEDRVSIMVSRATKDRLATYGYVSDTYEAVIIQLMDKADRAKEQELKSSAKSHPKDNTLAPTLA